MNVNVPFLAKIKTIHRDFIVKSCENSTARNKGKLGAIIAEGKDNGKYFKLNIGSGFTDFQREEFWSNKEKLLGKIIEIRADSISKSQDGKIVSDCRFKTFRGFEEKEKNLKRRIV